jgi:hypothetical protein
MRIGVTRHRKTLFALSALAIALAAVPFADFGRALESLVGAVYAADSHSSGGGEDKGKGGTSDGGHSPPQGDNGRTQLRQRLRGGSSVGSSGGSRQKEASDSDSDAGQPVGHGGVKATRPAS